MAGQEPCLVASCVARDGGGEAALHGADLAGAERVCAPRSEDELQSVDRGRAAQSAHGRAAHARNESFPDL